MPSSDYTAATSGKLKLKGGSGIDKKRKKKKPKPAANPPTAKATTVAQDLTSSEANKNPNADSPATLALEDAADVAAEATPPHEKTEAERRHEERRRKRLDERLKREGVKTHKERVEELNRYLSGLSEHHDMWVDRISFLDGIGAYLLTLKQA
jgi:protein FAM32A